MVVRRIREIIGVGAVGLAGFIVIGAGAAPVPARTGATAHPAPPHATPTGRPSAFGEVRPGLWEITTAGPGATPRRLCIDDAGALIQIAHAGAACSRLVVIDEPHRATVQYSCPGTGWGRTSLRVDAAGNVDIDTQGIADNAPFAWRAAARRAGECPR